MDDSRACNCSCSWREGFAHLNMLLYLAGFACAFFAGSMTRGRGLFVFSHAGRGTKAGNKVFDSEKQAMQQQNGYLEKRELRDRQGLSMIEQLVPEITHHVLTYLDFKSLCCMSMTNVAMKKAANDESAWKSLFEKDFNSEQSSVTPPNGWKAHYAETKAVTEVHKVFCHKVKTQSLRGLGRLWLPAGYVKCVHPGGELISGYDAVMATWQTVFTWNPGLDLQLRDTKVRVMGKVAWVTCKVFVNSLMEPLLLTNCYELHNDQWYVVHHHCSPLLEMQYPGYTMFG